MERQCHWLDQNYKWLMEGVAKLNMYEEGVASTIVDHRKKRKPKVKGDKEASVR